MTGLDTRALSAVPAKAPAMPDPPNNNAVLIATRPARVGHRADERGRADDHQRGGGRLVDALVEDVDEDRHGQNRAAPTHETEQEPD